MSDDFDRNDEPSRELFWEALGNTFRPYAGWIFYGFGVVLVLLGYLGISGESIVAKQLPYLISGGIGGILLAILGAYLLGMEELRRDGGRLDAMEKQVQELHQALLQRPDAPRLVPDHEPTRPGVPAVPSNGRSTHVVVVEAGESYHRAGCALVAGKAGEALEPTVAAGRGLRPCPVCEPLTTAS